MSAYAPRWLIISHSEGVLHLSMLRDTLNVANSYR